MKLFWSTKYWWKKFKWFPFFFCCKFIQLILFVHNNNILTSKIRCIATKWQTGDNLWLIVPILLSIFILCNSKKISTTYLINYRLFFKIWLLHYCFLKFIYLLITNETIINCNFNLKIRYWYYLYTKKRKTIYFLKTKYFSFSNIISIKHRNLIS